MADSTGDAPGTVVIREVGTGWAQIAQANHHTMKVDEPVALGGTDTGPDPYDYLLVALGSCTSMTIRMYAKRKGWPLDSVVVRLKHAKIHASDCESCELQVGRLDHIDREIELTGPLNAEQKQRLLEIADMCPVHRTLNTEVYVTTALRGSSPTT